MTKYLLQFNRAVFDFLFSILSKFCTKLLALSNLYFFSGLPNECSHYRGPYTVSCLNHIWIEQGCLSDGHGYPSNSNDEELDFFNRFNITYVVEIDT